MLGGSIPDTFLVGIQGATHHNTLVVSSSGNITEQGFVLVFFLGVRVLLHQGNVGIDQPPCTVVCKVLGG